MGKNMQATVKKHSPEAMNEFGEELGRQTSGFSKDFFNQLLNLSLGDKAKNQPEYSKTAKDANGPVPLFDVANHKKDTRGNAASEKYAAPKPKEERRAAIDYAGEILKTGERAERQKENRTMQAIQELLSELRRLANSSKLLQVEFASVAVDQAPTKVGEYHISFFEWMLIVVRTAREKVEDSGAWLSAVKGKGGKKRWGNKERKNYFANTSQSMSNESGGGVINNTG